MSQERMEATVDSTRPADVTYQRPDIDAVLSRASSATDKIRVVHGVNTQYFDNLEGKTVGKVKKSLREVFNIPGDAEATVDGKDVGDDFVLGPGMVLEFTKETGVKGVIHAYRDPRVMVRLNDAITCLERARDSDSDQDDVFFYDSIRRADEFIEQIMFELPGGNCSPDGVKGGSCGSST